MDDKAGLSARLLSADAASDVERGAKGFVEDDEVGICLSWANLNAFVPDSASKEKNATKKCLDSAFGHVRPGEMLALMGPSGSGKTTLLSILSSRPQLGKVCCRCSIIDS